MKFSNSQTVYDPAEDSYLLAGQVRKYAKGNVLDMGTGSGIQGFEALKCKKVIHVTFADINPKAVSYVKTIVNKDSDDYDKTKISFVNTNLFSKIKSTRKFDTIIFNPPYLPDDELDDEKLITTGGKRGYEIIDKFLKQSKKHLNIDGQILLLFSSLTDKGAVDNLIKKHSFEKNLIAKQGLFMEQLYVYLLKVHDDKILRGHRGIVEIKGKYAIKRSLNDSYDLKSEAKFLKLLNQHGIGPKFIKNDDKSLTMEYINGKRINDYLSTASKTSTIKVFKSILHQLFIMDKLGINKLELTNPYKHIIVRKNVPVLIDFERCIYTPKPKNITQFIQYLSSENVRNILSSKKINADKPKLLDIAKKYKDSMDEKYIDEIIGALN